MALCLLVSEQLSDPKYLSYNSFYSKNRGVGGRLKNAKIRSLTYSSWVLLDVGTLNCYCREESVKKSTQRGFKPTIERLLAWSFSELSYCSKIWNKKRNLYMNLMKKPDHKQSFRLSKVEALPARQCYRLNSTGNSWHMYIFGESCLLVKLL